MRSNIIKSVVFAVFFALAGVGLHFAAASWAPEKPREASLADISSSEPALGEVYAPREIPGGFNKDAPAPKDLAVQSAYVIDLSSGNEVFSTDKSKRWPLASLSKIMSSVIALENLDPASQITMSANAIATEGAAGSLSANENYSVNDLVIAMMVASSNDAAVALSENLPEGKFVELMNQKAADLGMSNTHFAEPSGLSSLNQSTLEDMAKLLSYVWKNHQGLFVSSSKPKGYIKELNSKKRREIGNINTLASRSNFLGGKTGFTEEARQNLIGVFSFDKRPMGVMILGAEDRVVEADKIISFLKDGYRSN